MGIDYANVAPYAVEKMYGLEKYVRERGLEPSLLELVKLRASQINSCAYRHYGPCGGGHLVRMVRHRIEY